MSYFKRATWWLAIVILGVIVLPGCKQPKPAASGSPGKDAAGHPEEGPHGGALAEWGSEEYHAEFTVNHKEKKATVYILDGEVKKAVPIKAESITLTITNAGDARVTITLKADPQKDEPKGASSRFSGTHDALAKEMEFKGNISGKVDGKDYSGDFEEKPHKHK